MQEKNKKRGSVNLRPLVEKNRNFNLVYMGLPFSIMESLNFFLFIVFPFLFSKRLLEKSKVYSLVNNLFVYIK